MDGAGADHDQQTVVLAAQDALIESGRLWRGIGLQLVADALPVFVKQAGISLTEQFKKLKADKQVSEDEAHRAQDEVQKVTDEFSLLVQLAMPG